MNLPPKPPAARAAASLPQGHLTVAGRIGVLTMNVGTPEGTDYRSMRRYLQEFLSDRAGSSRSTASCGGSSSTASS